MGMNIWKSVAALMLAVAGTASAGPIEVEIDGVVHTTTYNSGDEISINVGVFTGVKRVRIYDSTLGGNGLPDDTIGKVIIDGTPSETFARMDFWATRASSFPTQSNQPILQLGALSFGSNSADGLTITNESLRRRTLVAIAVVNNIRGDITAGQIFRLQAGAPNIASGEVSANVTAVSRDRDWLGTGKQAAIAEVNVVGLLSGNILASDFNDYTPGDDSTYANIGRVIVRGGAFTYPTQTGGFRVTAIVGDILAPTGRISEILTIGSIGASDAIGIPGEQGEQPTITAADGIARILTRIENDNSEWPRVVEATKAILRANVTARPCLKSV